VEGEYKMIATIKNGPLESNSKEKNLKSLAM
jgi:hypothetical protein